MSDEEVSDGGGGGGKGKLIVIILAVLILLGGGGAAVWFLFLAPGETGEEEEIEETAAVSGAAEPLEEPQFMSLGTYIANLKDGRRYLKSTITIMLSESSAVEYLTPRLSEVKDIVLTELQNLSTEDTKQPESKEALKNKIITKISELFPRKPDWDDPEPIKKVLFEEFYVQ